MPTLLDSVRRGVHDTAAALIDNNIPAKVSDLVTATTNRGFTIVGDLLTIVRDLTDEAVASSPLAADSAAGSRARRSRSRERTDK